MFIDGNVPNMDKRSNATTSENLKKTLEHAAPTEEERKVTPLAVCSSRFISCLRRSCWQPSLRLAL